MSNDALKAFLADPTAPKDAPTYFEFEGFVFTVAAAPELIRPSEWLPVAFGGAMPTFRTLDEARRIHTAAIALYNARNAEVIEGKVRLPRGCRFRDDVMANVEDDAPVGQWARGFVRGHGWLEESWDQPLPDELNDELGAVAMTLSFFASRKLAEAFHAEGRNPETTLEELAAKLRELFPDAMMSYAHLGRSIYQAMMHVEQRRVERVGRNEACPCGSGRKFKRCCGMEGRS